MPSSLASFPRVGVDSLALVFGAPPPAGSRLVLVFWHWPWAPRAGRQLLMLAASGGLALVRGSLVAPSRW